MRSALITFVIAVAVLVVLRGPIARAAHLGGTTVNAPSTRPSDGEVTQDVTVDNFHGVEMNGSIDFIVTQSSETKVQWYTDPATLQYLEAKVVDGILTLGPKDGAPSDAIGKVRAVVFTPNLDQVMVNGSCDASVQSLNTDHFRLMLNGSGSVVVVGKAGSVEAVLDGSGNLGLQSLEAVDAKVEVNGSGEVTVNASKTLDATIAGSGDIHYLGKPQINSQIAGSGNIVQG